MVTRRHCTHRSGVRSRISAIHTSPKAMMSARPVVTPYSAWQWRQWNFACSRSVISRYTASMSPLQLKNFRIITVSPNGLPFVAPQDWPGEFMPSFVAHMPPGRLVAAAVARIGKREMMACMPIPAQMGNEQTSSEQAKLWCFVARWLVDVLHDTAARGGSETSWHRRTEQPSSFLASLD